VKSCSFIVLSDVGEDLIVTLVAYHTRKKKTHHIIKLDDNRVVVVSVVVVVCRTSDATSPASPLSSQDLQHAVRVVLNMKNNEDATVCLIRV
jgi:hypothetical protein